MVHTGRDKKIDTETAKIIQSKVNGNKAMVNKFLKVGSVLWGQVDRLRETMINNSLSVCPIYLTYKDNKDWSSSKDGNISKNLHMSEITDSFANNWETIG